MDDGSPDHCGAICDEYAQKDPRVRVIHKENGGLSSARNAGIDVARGDWLSFVDSDDYIHPQMLEILLDAVRTAGTKISSCGFVRTAGESLPEEVAPKTEAWTPKDYYLKHCVEATVAWGKLYHRDCFQNIRYPLGKLHEDEFVTYRILFAEPQVAVIPEPLYGYYQNPNGIMGTWNPKRLDVLEALCKQMEYFLSLDDDQLSRDRMYTYPSCVRRQRKAIEMHPSKAVARRSLHQCRKWTRRMLKLYRSRFRYSMLDYQDLYEFAYPAWIIKVVCGSWKWLSGVKQSLKGR